jgi:CRP/FNR family transcriptional regulator, cyclic AMP receptor protein
MVASVEDIAQFLAKVPLFHGLKENQLTKIARRCRERDYTAGETIIEQGKVGVGLFIVVRGEARVVRHQADGEEFELDQLKRTDFFGELSLLDDAPRSATVVAVDEVKCLVLSKLDFLDELTADAEMGIVMLKTMSQRYRRLVSNL